MGDGVVAAVAAPTLSRFHFLLYATIPLHSAWIVYRQCTMDSVQILDRHNSDKEEMC